MMRSDRPKTSRRNEEASPFTYQVFRRLFRAPPSAAGRAYRFFLPSQIMYASGVAGHLVFIPIMLAVGAWQIAVLNVASAPVFAGCYLANRRGHPHVAFLVAIAAIVAHTALGVRVLSWESGFGYYLFTLVTFALFNPLWPGRMRLLAGLVLGVVFFVIHAATVGDPALAPASSTAIRLVHDFNALVALGAFAAIGYYFNAASDIAQRQLEQLSRTDVLTGLANRREALERLKLEGARSSRTKTPCALIMSDIDHFKRFNDEYGHDAGDFVLQATSEILRDNVREQDLVSRYGGEEFLLVLPDTDLDGGIAVAKKIRKELHERSFEYEGHTFTVRMTFGVAEYRGRGTVDSAVKRADEALYRGKEAGRDRVVSTPRE